MLTLIYIDSLLLLNFIINYLILLLSAKITGGFILRWRLAAGSFLGALYAVAIFLPHMSFLSSLPFKLIFALLMTMTAFGLGGRLLKNVLVVFGVSFIFGGAALAVQMGLGGGYFDFIHGVPYIKVSFRMLLITAGAAYAILGLLFQRLGKHSGRKGQLLEVTVFLGDKNLKLDALMDTGNTLSDPVSNMPVLIADWEIARQLFPAELKSVLNQAAFLNPVSLLESLSLLCEGQRFRLLPYKAVGVASGMLLAVKTDRIVSGERTLKGALLAFSPTELSDGGSYKALIGVI